MQYLLLKGRDTGVWSFPKGHQEKLDATNQLRTAVRETEEETGFIVGRDYTIIGNSIRFGKRPYWLGLMNEDCPGTLTLSPREHSQFAWLSWTEICWRNHNIDVRDWVKKSQSPNSEFTRLLGFVSAASS